MKKIGVYCGSFNPVHNGHIAIASACIEEGLVDEVLIVATGAYWEKNDFYPLKDRIAMLKLAAKEGILIDETHNEIPYTCMIFKKLQEENKDAKYSLIIGADNLPRLREWKNYEFLLQFDFIILPRGDIERGDVDAIMKDLHKENYVILNRERIDISSTYIREHLNDHEAIKDMIDEKVYAYLKTMEEKDAARDPEQTSIAG